jgi:Uma2 family endonuclease
MTASTIQPPEAIAPRVEHLVTEDDTPVDNFPSAKNQRLLVDAVYSSGYFGARPFVADANVGIFISVRQPPRVPDVFLSLDVQLAEDWWQKQHRSYFVWEFGKLPEVVIEIVSNADGGELGDKLRDYAHMGVLHYAVFDPARIISDSELQAFLLVGRRYEPIDPGWLEEAGIGLTVWQGEFEDKKGVWMRWCDQSGKPLPTGKERAEAAEAKVKALEAELAALRRQ